MSSNPTEDKNVKNRFKGNIRKVLYWSATGILAAVFVFAALMIARHFYDEKKSAGQFEELTELIQETEPETPEVKEPTAAEKYASVEAQNADFVGWIKIEGTRVDYPVVQKTSDPHYYLRRGFDKKYSYYGVPYVAGICTVDGCDNTIIYGHNMTNGTMFSDLGKYTSKEYWEEHRFIQFDTLEGYGTYEIIAVFKTVSGAKDEFKYHQFAEGDEDAFKNYVSECKARALYETELTAVPGDRLLTLSTCEYSRKNGRLAIVAKRIK